MMIAALVGTLMHENINAEAILDARVESIIFKMLRRK